MEGELGNENESEEVNLEVGERIGLRASVGKHEYGARECSGGVTVKVGR